MSKLLVALFTTCVITLTPSPAFSGGSGGSSPPPQSKGNGDTSYFTTYKFSFPDFTPTHSSTTSTYNLANIPTSKLNSGTGATSSTFWRGDGTWATPASGSTAYTPATPTLWPTPTPTTYAQGLDSIATQGGFVRITDPSALSGLKLWLKADAGTFKNTACSTAASANNDAVQCWQDQSGNSNDATAIVDNQAHLHTSVVNSLSGIAFDGAASALTLPDLTGYFRPGPASLFIAFSTTTTSTTQVLMDIENVAATTVVSAIYDASSNLMGFKANQFYPTSSTQINVFGNSDAGNIAWTAPAITAGESTVHTLGMVVNYGASTLQVDGQKNTRHVLSPAGWVGNSGAAVSILGVRGNMNTFWAGDIFEVVLYNRALSTQETAAVMSYLQTRW